MTNTKETKHIPLKGENLPMVFPEKTGSIELLRYYKEHFGIEINEASKSQFELLSEFKAESPKAFDYETFFDVLLIEKLNPGMDHSVSCTRNGRAALMMSMREFNFKEWTETLSILFEYKYDVLFFPVNHSYFDPGKSYTIVISETDESPKELSDIYKTAQRRVHYNAGH